MSAYNGFFLQMVNSNVQNLSIAAKEGKFHFICTKSNVQQDTISYTLVRNFFFVQILHQYNKYLFNISKIISRLLEPYEELVLGSEESVKNAPFMPNADFKIIVHGYTGTKDKPPVMVSIRNGNFHPVDACSISILKMLRISFSIYMLNRIFKIEEIQHIGRRLGTTDIEWMLLRFSFS